MTVVNTTGRWFTTVLALLALLFAGCGGSDQASPGAPFSGAEFPVEVGASDGVVIIESRPDRIVSLSPTATEILFAIGAGPQVVAVDEESSYPDQAPRTELSGYTPNVEALATYRPDLVVYSNEPGNLASSLDSIAVPGILQPAASRLNDTYAQILDLGLATGRPAAAEKLVDEMKAHIAEVVEDLPRFARPPTYYHELDESYYSATSRTFIGEIYSLLGLVNIADPADKLGRGYPQLSGELIIQSNPDFIFLADARCCGQSATTVAARPGWEKIAAVQDNGVVELDDDVASRWGPRVVDFLDLIAARIRPFEPSPR